MSGAAFTGGPWTAETYREDHPQFGIFAPKSVILARVWIAEDARLIAAAPTLLEALEALVECFIKRGPFDEPLGSSEQAPSINAGVAAIAKARGEPAERAAMGGRP
jgi:hypothetical protein